MKRTCKDHSKYINISNYLSLNTLNPIQDIHKNFKYSFNTLKLTYTKYINTLQPSSIKYEKGTIRGRDGRVKWGTTLTGL